MASGATASTATTDPKDSRWFLTQDQIQNSPSRKDGVPPDQELNLRQKAAYLIQDMGQKLRVSQLCINTAIVYMHRFYMFHSFQIFHRNGIAAAALFLAAKVEEQPRKLETVIQVLHASLNLKIPEPQTVAYQEQAQDLVFNENVLLQTLGFDVAVDHPHTHVVKTCHLVKACKDLAQTSYFLASNSLHLTTMCLQYRPTVVACFCIYLACKWSRWEIPQSTEGKYWFHYVDRTVTMEILEQLTNEFLVIYDNSPSRLKKQLSSCKGLGLNSKSPGQQPGQQQAGSSNSSSRSQHTSSAEHRSSSSSHHRSSLHHHAKQPPPSHAAGSAEYSKQQQQMSSVKSTHNMPASSAVATTSSSNSLRQRPDRTLNIPPEPHFSAPHRTAGTTKGSALLSLTRGNIPDNNAAALSLQPPPLQSTTSSSLTSSTTPSSIQQHLHPPRPSSHPTHEQTYQPGASSSSSSSKNRGLLHTPSLSGSSTSISQTTMLMNSQDSSQRHPVNKSDLHNKHRHGTKEHHPSQQQQQQPHQSKSNDMSKTKIMYQTNNNEHQKGQLQSSSSASRSTYPTQQPPPNYNQAMTNLKIQQDHSPSVLMQQHNKSINNIGGTAANNTTIESSFRLTDDIGRNNDLMEIDSPSIKQQQQQHHQQQQQQQQQQIKAPSIFSPEWNEKPSSVLSNMNKVNVNSNTILANTGGGGGGAIVKSLNPDSPSRKQNNNTSDRQQQRQQRANKIYPDSINNIANVQLPPPQLSSSSNDRNNLQTKRSHPEDLIQQEDGIDFRDAKYRKVDNMLPPPAHQQSAISLAPSFSTLRQSTTIDPMKVATSTFNGIETDPALVSSLLKESLCTDNKYSSTISTTSSSSSSAGNQLSNIPPHQLLQQPAESIKNDSIVSQQQQPPMNNIQSGQSIIQQQYPSTHHLHLNHQLPPPPALAQHQQILPPTPTFIPPPIKQENDTNLSSQLASAPTPSTTVPTIISSSLVPLKAEIHNEHEIKIKSEKKKKKEKHKHKEKDKDKSKDREERKKHKKDKERQKDRERNDEGSFGGGGGGNNNGGSGNGHNPIKITIPKDKLNLSSSSTGTGINSQDQSLPTLQHQQQQPTSGFKITIPKERIKSDVPPPPSSSSSNTQQQQPTSLKIKISKDMIESYNNYGGSSGNGGNYEQSGYHQNNGSGGGGGTILSNNSAVSSIGSNTTSSSSSSSSKKKDKDRDKERGEKSKSSKNLDYIKQNGNGNIGGGGSSTSLQTGSGGGHLSNNTGRSGGGNGSSSSSKVR